MGFIRQTPAGSEYAASGYGVTVRPDGAIHVKHGDSLSKYSMAIYGDFANMDRKFGRRNGGQVRSFQELGADINVIRAGETLYQMTRHNTYGRGAVETPLIPPVADSPVEQPQPEIQRRLAEVVDYIQRVAWIGTDWQVTGSDGIGVGIGSPGVEIGGAINAMRFWLKRPQDAEPVTMWGGSIGGSIGLAPEPVPVEVSFSLSSFPSAGVILKSPSSGATLSKSELSGLAVTIELAGHFVGGGSVIAILGGPSIYEFLTNPVRSTAQLCMAKWLLISAGTSFLTGVEVSVTGSAGYMYTV